MIKVHQLKKSFGDVHVLNGVEAHVERGECICIIGPSGSGKSTFLRCLNLLETPDEGEILVNGEEILDPKLNIDKYRENVGMVFQHFNLFPICPSCIISPLLRCAWESGSQENLRKRHWSFCGG